MKKNGSVARHAGMMRGALPGALALLVSVAGALSASAAPTHSLFNPMDYTPLGSSLTVSSGSVAIDTKDGTTTPTLAVGATTHTGVIVTNQSGSVVMALFCYGDIGVSNGVTCTVTGNLGLVLASRGDLTFAGTLNARGGNGVSTAGGRGGPGAEGGSADGTTLLSNPPGAGNGNGGTGADTTGTSTDGTGRGGGQGGGSSGGGGGGGYGGVGGAGTFSGGASYGDSPVTNLFGGSGGGGGRGNGGGGGGGGGAVEFVAVRTLRLSGTLNALGGNGEGGASLKGGGGGSGGVVVLAANLLDVTGGSVSAKGGAGGQSGYVKGGGGGGGGRIALFRNTSTGSLTTDVSGGAGGDGYNIGTPDGEAGSNGTVSAALDFPWDPPVAGGQSLQVAPNDATNLTLTATDANGDALTVTNTTLPTLGTLSGWNGSNVTYTAGAGTGLDSFKFVAFDGMYTSTEATVTILIESGANTAPVAHDFASTNLEDTAHSILLQASDADGHALTFSIAQNPANGELSGLSGSNVVYTPATNWYGTDSFKFTANDGAADSNTGTVTVVVQPVTDLPAIANVAAVGVGSGSATLVGRLVFTDDADTTVLLHWSTNADLMGAAEADLGVRAVGLASNTVAGLAADTTYYYRFSAGNAAGTARAPTTNSFHTLLVYGPKAARNSLFNPMDYASLGLLEVAGGTIAIDTKDGLTSGPTLMAVAGATTNTYKGVVVPNQSGSCVLALFCFDTIGISNSVTCSVTGNLGLVLASRGGLTFAGTLSATGRSGGTSDPYPGGRGGSGAEGGSADGTTLLSNPPGTGNGNGGTGANTEGTSTDGTGRGGGQGGSSSGGGGGGGYGGVGGAGLFPGGPDYGDPAITNLYGGSGGGGGRGNGGGGGGGGGAVEFVAFGALRLTGTINVSGGNGGGGATLKGGGGGSGGGVILAADKLDVTGGSILATGGAGGQSGYVKGGGGGGGGRVALYRNVPTGASAVATVTGGTGGSCWDPQGLPGDAGSDGSFDDAAGTFPFFRRTVGTVLLVW